MSEMEARSENTYFQGVSLHTTPHCAFWYQREAPEGAFVLYLAHRFANVFGTDRGIQITSSPLGGRSLKKNSAICMGNSLKDNIARTIAFETTRARYRLEFASFVPEMEADVGLFVNQLYSVVALRDSGILDKLSGLCSKIVLFGSRASGVNRPNSDFDLYLVMSKKPFSKTKDCIVEILHKSALARAGTIIESVIWSPEDHEKIKEIDPALENKVNNGVSLWNNQT